MQSAHLTKLEYRMPVIYGQYYWKA